MNNTEYKNRLADHETYNSYDYLNPDEVKALRHNLKKQAESENVFILEGFNNRAIVERTQAGYILTSYNTKVLLFDPEAGEIKKLWHGYSVTTLKHINIFLQFFGIPVLSKKEWIAIDC